MTRLKPLVRSVALVLALLAVASVCWRFAYRPSEEGASPQPPAALPQLVVEVVGDLAITNVAVIDVNAGVAQSGQTVVIRGDRIAVVRPATECRVAAGTKVVDGTGKFLIPGLWDMHVHLVHESILHMFVENGVTGIRHMFSFNPMYRYQRPAVDGIAVHPRVVAAHELLDGPDTPFSFPSSRNVVIGKDDLSGRAGVRELRRRGNDFVKVYAKLPRDSYFAALEEAKTLGVAVCGHLPHAVTATEASDAGQLTIEHLGGVAIGCSSAEARHMVELRDGSPGVVRTRTDVATGWRIQVKAHESHNPSKAAEMFERFRKNGTWHVPTQVVTRATSTLGDEHFPDPVKAMPKLVADFWQRELKDGGVRLPMVGLSFTRSDLVEWKGLYEKDRELVRRMHTAGVRMLAGTDTPAPYVVPGHSLHEELGLFVEAGLSHAEALRTATLNPALCLGREKDHGTVEVGKYADLVLLSANPLIDIRNTHAIEMVAVGGRVVPR